MFDQVIKMFLADIEKDFTPENIQQTEEKIMTLLNALARITGSLSKIAAEIAPLTGPYAPAVAGGATLGSTISGIVAEMTNHPS